jgi:hypothetical protein
MLRNSDYWEGRYDFWKLDNRVDELERRKRTGLGGKWGTVEYEYVVEKIGKCPCCEESILEDDMFTEDEKGNLYHFQCFNYMKRQEEEEKKDGRK